MRLLHAAKNFKETVLDEKTQTWKSPADIEDLKSVIDATTLEPDKGQAAPEEPHAQSSYVDSKENSPKKETPLHNKTDLTKSSSEISEDGDTK